MQVQGRQPIDDRRRVVFLDVLRQTGSMAAAAAAATPHAEGRRPGYTSFRDLIRRDPEFAEQVAEARQHALGLVEKTIAERALTPERRPVFERGKLVGWQEDRRSSDRLLLALARRLSPEWDERQQLQVDGRVLHEHAHAMFHFAPEHLLLLGKDEQVTLIGLLEKIETRMGKEVKDGRQRALPAPTDPVGEGDRGVADRRRA